MNALQAIDKQVYSALATSGNVNAAVSGRIHAEVAPPGTAIYPCITFARMSAKDVVGAGAVRIATRALYLVQVIGQDNGYAEIDPIAEEIDGALDNMRVEMSDGTILSCFREEPFSQVDIDSGRYYYRRGGIYRIMVH